MIKIQRTNKEHSISSSEVERAYDSLRGRLDLGFMDLPNRQELFSRVETRVSEISSDIRYVVVIGIGGSSLGGITLKQAFVGLYSKTKIFFIETVDHMVIRRILGEVEISKTHWVPISKSGSTLETLSITNFVADYCAQYSVDIRNNCTVITEEKESPLWKWANSSKAGILPIPYDVGGRFSVLSPVGLFPAACIGVPLESLKSGGQWALEQKNLVCEIAGHALGSFARGEWVTQFWIYSAQFSKLGSWIQQLWAESLGKAVDRDGNKALRSSFPVGCEGPVDQHSVLQQVMEGGATNWICLIREAKYSEELPLPGNMFPELEILNHNNLSEIMMAEATATFEAMTKAGISGIELTIDNTDPKTLAALFMTFELVVGTIGEYHNIDAFNQPGVELGKKLAKQKLLGN